MFAPYRRFPRFESHIGQLIHIASRVAIILDALRWIHGSKTLRFQQRTTMNTWLKNATFLKWIRVFETLRYEEQICCALMETENLSIFFHSRTQKKSQDFMQAYTEEPDNCLSKFTRRLRVARIRKINHHIRGIHGWRRENSANRKAIMPRPPSR